MPQEKKIVALKYAAKRFGVMDETERDLAANKILIRISIITGWTVPASEMLMDELVNQLSKKLEESYPNANVEEFEYAFRNKGLDIKDWGKSINLALIDEVMMPYLDNRFDLSMQEEKISSQLKMSEADQKMLEQSKELSDEEWQEWLQDISKYEINKIPCDSYNYLERTQKLVLTKEEKHRYMERAIAHLSGVLDPLSREGIEFAAMKKAGVYDTQVTGTLITISKRLAVYDYLNKKSDESVTTTN